MTGRHHALLVAALAAALMSPAVLAEDLQPVHAQPIQPVHAQPIQAVHAQAIQAVHAQPIQAVQARPLQPEKSAGAAEANGSPTSQASASRAGVQSFVGSWNMWVPGAAYTTPGAPGSGYDTLHTSVGALARGLIIRGNYTYTWEGKDGRWRLTADPEYPLLLVNGVDGHDWKVGTGAGVPGLSERNIILWDNYVYYYGARARPGT